MRRPRLFLGEKWTAHSLAGAPAALRNSRFSDTMSLLIVQVIVLTETYGMYITGHHWPYVLSRGRITAAFILYFFAEVRFFARMALLMLFSLVPPP